MRKAILIFLGCTALLLAGGYLFLRFSLQRSVSKQAEKNGQPVAAVDSLGGKKVSALDLRPLFLQRVQQLIKKTSNDLYELSVSDVQVDMLASTIQLHEVKLQPNKARQEALEREGALPENVLDIQVKNIALEGINLDDALTRRTMDYKLIKMVQPMVVIHRQKETQKKDPASGEEWSQRFLQEMKKLSIEKLEVDKGSLVVYNKTNGGKPLRFTDLSIRMNQIQIDSATRHQKDRFLFARNAVLSLRNFSKPTVDGLYNMNIGTVHINAAKREVKLSGLSFASPLSRKQFVRRQKKSKEMYRLSLPSLTLRNVNWWTLLNEEEVTASEVDIDGGKLSVYLDRSLPPKNKMGNFPNQLLMKLPIKLSVAKAQVRNMEVAYSEYNPLSQKEGTVYISKINLAIANLDNQSRIPVSLPFKAKGTALFMHSVPLQVQFSFNRRQYQSGQFSAHIKAAGFEGRLVNSFAQPLGLVRMDRGTLQGAEATISGDEQKAGGEIFIPYTDLKLSLLEKDKDKEGLDKKDVTSVLANVLLLKNNNPKKGEEPRKVQAEFIRQPEGGFFMLVWKTLLVGALKTIGAPTKIAYKKPGAGKK